MDGFERAGHQAWVWLGLIGLLILPFSSAHAAERVALVIGNGAYENTAALPNPRNDATDMARLLEDELGFEVQLHLDVGREAMESAVFGFGRQAETAELALVFYAGHGIEFEGRNYLLPVDAPPLTHERQVRRLIPLEDVIAESDYARGLGIVLVDACRDNPLANNLRTALGASRSAAVSRGLGRIERQPEQTLVVYATEAGSVAADGRGRNSPFTTGLLKHLPTPGLEVGRLFREVRDEVMQATGSRQRPFVYSSLGREPIYLAMGGEGHDGVPPLSLPPVGVDPAEEAWSLIRAMPDGEAKRQALTGFIDRYPDSPLAYAAELALSALTAEAAPSPPPPIAVEPTDSVTLTVRPTPADARVRIMNIAPVYRDGIELKPGEPYDIEVSVPGYETYRREHQFEAGPIELSIKLEERRRSGHGELVRDRLRSGEEGPVMVFLRGGAFMMGSPNTELGRRDSERQHEVEVADFLIARTEVTVGEFRRFVQATSYRTDAESNAGGEQGCWAGDASDGNWVWRRGRTWRNPGYVQDDKFPVVCVSWNDAQAYAKWLSQQTGETYRLPTEAEWEYAARAGTTNSRYWGNNPDDACRYANVADSSPGDNRFWHINKRHSCKDGYWYPAPVGHFEANPWGLRDMLGNVWEWTCSVYDSNYGGAERRCAADGEDRVLRGGAWNDGPDSSGSGLAGARAAARSRDLRSTRGDVFGFRLARSP